MIEVGKKPPDFQLHDQNKTIRSLKDFAGKKTVLAFFPGAFTSVCTREMCEFRDATQPLMDLGAQVVGIDVNDPFTNKAFAEKNELPFQILSDYERDAVREYGISHENFAGLDGYTVAKRSVFILDEVGVVRYKWVSNDPSKEPDLQEILSQLSELVVK